MSDTLKVLDLFAGGGGFSTGFLQVNKDKLEYNFEITKAVEIDHAACDTLRRHLGSDKVIQGDITHEGVKEELYNTCSDVNVVIGGPPCQTFSLAGPARSGTKEMREKLKNDPRNTLYQHFFEIVDMIEPDFVVFENVEGMLSKKTEIKELKGKQAQVIELVCAELESKGYETEVENLPSRRFQVLNAVDFGVPQHRRRIIIIANRSGLKNPCIEPTHGNDRIPYRTVDSIKNLPARLPKISLSKKLKNINVMEEYYRDSLQIFVGKIKYIAENVPNLDHKRSLEKLYNKLNVEYLSIKDNQSNKIDNLKKFIELYNKLIIKYEINEFENSSLLINHQSRVHNFRDVIIFIKTKSGSNSSRFMNPNSDDYCEMLDRLYPYDKSKHKDTYVKHCWDKPSNTILAHMEKDGLKFIHPTQPRTLTPYEAQLLQSFPIDYVFCGGRNDQYRQIGNAVPPKLAEVIGKSILETFRKSKINNK